MACQCFILLFLFEGEPLMSAYQKWREWADAKVCCDGTSCHTADLKVGSRIRVTSSPDDKHTATKIESLDKNAEFAKTA